MTRQQVYITFMTIITVVIVIFVIEFLYIKYSGTFVPAPSITREYPTIGNGTKLRYAVMGDSTSISQGSEYDDGYAVASARHLARSYQVSLLNVGVSGATAETVRRDQLPKAKGFTPDLVLIAVGANDATKFTSAKNIEDSLQQIIDGLKEANKNVKIVVTGSPAMDSVSRFPFLSKWVMYVRTAQVNAVFDRLIKQNDLTHAPIARETRQAFLNDPTLTADDHFHPNKRGYALWIPVINKAIDESLKQN